MYQEKFLPSFELTASLKLLKMKKNTEMTKRITDVMVAVTATFQKVQQQNSQGSSHLKGSGYVPANFLAGKVHIVIVPG
jgi:hypothetical protein